MTKRFTYPDEGCSKARNKGYFGPCLECPLDECLEMECIIIARIKRRRAKHEEIRERFSKGESKADLAIAFGVSQKTVSRAVRNAN